MESNNSVVKIIILSVGGAVVLLLIALGAYCCMVSFIYRRCSLVTDKVKGRCRVPSIIFNQSPIVFIQMSFC